MCFTPFISLTTAVVEWGIATFLIVRNPTSSVAKIAGIFLYALGMYQFTEYMLCTTGNLVWVTIGFVTYTFLPAMGLSFALSYPHFHVRRWVVYLPATIFSLIAIFTPHFVVEGVCAKMFIITKNMFISPSVNPITTYIYWIVYAGYLVSASCILFWKGKKGNNKRIRIIRYLVAAAIVCTAVPPLLFIMVFPSYGSLFPSIYCEFALFFTVVAVLSVYAESKKGG